MRSCNNLNQVQQASIREIWIHWIRILIVGVVYGIVVNGIRLDDMSTMNWMLVLCLLLLAIHKQWTKDDFSFLPQIIILGEWTWVGYRSGRRTNRGLFICDGRCSCYFVDRNSQQDCTLSQEHDL